MGSAQFADASLDPRRHLVGTAIGFGGLVGERTETVVGVAHKPAVQSPAIDAVADRSVFDGGSIEDLSDGVVALLNHRKIRQWHDVLLGSGEHK
ncbi:MAG TPA: hypothetical protein VHF69_09990 [Candidatus Synoicihabitans sp.]|nr:hypothetical protein [Candidatus Synoicihabitans sp.]